MDSKIIAIIAVAVVVVAGAATAVVVMNNDKGEAEFNDGAFSLISRVNSEGSGVYIKITAVDDPAADVPARNGTPYYKVESDKSYTVSAANKAAWGGLVVGTPGTSSIQHVQMATLVSNMGLKFQLYQAGETKNNDTVYYNAGITNASLALAADIDAGILWEPQYTRIIQDEGFQSLALTNNLFPGHTCCVIAASHNYLEGNNDATVAFLAGYAKAVDFINAAKADKTGDNYNWFVDFTADKTGQDKSVVTEAIDNITYLYADDNNGSLGKLRDSVDELAAGLKDLGVLTRDVNDMGKLLDAFVQDKYLKDAVQGTINKSTNGKLTVAAISGDIHQIALHVAIEKGYFTEYGVEVTVSYAANGAGVATSVQNGEAQMGFLGAPPATITTINAGLITA